MNRLIIVCLLVFSSSFIASSQVSMSFPAAGPSNPVISFNKINYWVEYEFDTISTFNSHLYRTKICKGKYTDTVMRLKLARTYHFRCRQIDNKCNPVSDWYYTQYSTANYPLSNFFDSKVPVYINYPFHKFTYAFSNKADFWFDTQADFKSPRAVKTTILNNLNPTFLPAYKYDTLYIRSKVYDINDSLPWKTAMLIRDFKPDAYFSPYIPCNDSTKFYTELFYNINSTFRNNTCKSYISYGTYSDSAISTNYIKSMVLVDNQAVRIISVMQFNEDTFSGSFTDTTYLSNPLSLGSALSYNIFTTPNTSIRINTNACNTGIELELHSDSTYSNLISSQYKNNKTTSSPLLFQTAWDYFNPYALRYRIIRCGIKGQWFNIPKYYIPNIAHSEPLSVDTTNSKWTIFHNNVLTGKTLEVEHDINAFFNSPKKKSYQIKDSSSFILESLFGRHNFVRCRIKDGPMSNNWSNTTFKYFTNKTITDANTTFSQPLWTCTPKVLGYSGFQMIFGRAENKLIYSIKSMPLQSPDTFDFVDGDTVYFKLRRYTPIDTSAWGPVLKGVFRGDINLCFVPYITYNGYQNGLDTFHIKWKEKNPLYAKGYKLYFGPEKNTYKGIIDLPKTQFSYTINRKQYPANWYFSVYPTCNTPNNYSGIPQVWYPLNGINTGIENNFISTVFYSQQSGRVINNSDETFTFKLFDNLGRMIEAGSIHALESIALPSIDPGVYHLELDNGQQQFQQKILIL